MEDVTFAPALAADLPAVHSLLERCDLPTVDLLPEHMPRFFVCRAGERLAATVGLETLGDIGLLRSLAVAPEFRGRRLAHDLWARARADARRRGVRHLYLLTTTAARLFARWGFHAVAREAVPEAVRRTTEFSVLCPSSAAVMTLDLGSDANHLVL